MVGQRLLIQRLTKMLKLLRWMLKWSLKWEVNQSQEKMMKKKSWTWKT